AQNKGQDASYNPAGFLTQDSKRKPGKSCNDERQEKRATKPMPRGRAQVFASAKRPDLVFAISLFLARCVLLQKGIPSAESVSISSCPKCLKLSCSPRPNSLGEKNWRRSALSPPTHCT